MMALIAIMGKFNILVLKMIWHGNSFNHFFFPGLNFRVMAFKAQGGNFFFFFNGKRSNFFFHFLHDQHRFHDKIRMIWSDGDRFYEFLLHRDDI